MKLFQCGSALAEERVHSVGIGERLSTVTLRIGGAATSENKRPFSGVHWLSSSADRVLELVNSLMNLIEKEN